jgi:pyrroloquinoline quinone biosynthesis protein B
MQVILLGTAAGGGFPQWNCGCAGCRTARHDPSAARPRTQSCVAVSADGERWFLLNASPDVRAQLALLPGGEPSGSRRTPVEGIVLTDAELDHTVGLLLLREGGALPLYCTGAVAATLERDTRLLPILRAFATVPLTLLDSGSEIPLADHTGAAAGLSVEAFPVAGHAPRFARCDDPGATTGLLLRSGGRTCAYVPGCATVDPALLERLAAADLVLFDGTFWSDGELAAVTGGSRSARDMGHLPIGGADGSLAPLSRLGARVVYVHLNNTNPVLLEQSAERAQVVAAGLIVGADGMTFDL